MACLSSNVGILSAHRCALYCLFALLLAHSTAVLAQEDDASIVSVEQVRLTEIDTQWRLNVLLNIELSRVIRRGLDSGVPLQFILNVQIKRPNKFWPDKTLLEIEQRFSLTYYELTRHYRLHAFESKKSRNFRSLLPALEALGQVPAITLKLPDQSPLVGRLTMKLDENALPLPLKSLFSSTWRLASEEFFWPIN